MIVQYVLMDMIIIVPGWENVLEKGILIYFIFLLHPQSYILQFCLLLPSNLNFIIIINK